MLAAEDRRAGDLSFTPAWPWEFVYNSARHCSDETRQLQAGDRLAGRSTALTTRRCRRTRASMPGRSQYDPATQYCLLTMGNEKARIPPIAAQRLAAYRGGRRPAYRPNS